MSPKFKKIIRFSLAGTTIIGVTFYLLACLVPFLNTGKYWIISLLGLVFPLLFFILLGFSIYWLIQKSKWFFICIAALLLGWQQISVMVSFSSNKKLNLAKTPETLRVLTWNLSSWGESNRAFKKNNMNVMIPLIKNINADVLCFQEYLYFKNSTYRDSIIPALKEKGYLYSYFAQTNYTARMYKTAVLTAVVIISKYPIIDTAQFEYNKGDFAEPAIYADIKINEKTVRVFTTHLQSVQFEYNDYDALSKLKEPYKASVQQSRATAGKLKYAYKRRALQADILYKKITESPYPVIVCGDFNDVPNSYTYFTIKGNLQDAFLKKGSGFGRTFRFISPTLRIDYILADKKFEVKQYKKFEAPYSDHYPVIADFIIMK
jgi:endonuclease/exonuclease/phosphatase family metal-dependent hydrolase